MKLTNTTIGQLGVGDLLILPESPADNLQTIEVATLQTHRSGRISIWIAPSPDFSLRTSWRLGTFQPSAPIQKVELG